MGWRFDRESVTPHPGPLPVEGRVFDHGPRTVLSPLRSLREGRGLGEVRA
jgi:hypothetical protein